MKKSIIALTAIAAGLVGCAHDRHYSRHNDRYYVSEEHPRGAVIIDRDGNRTYVREYDRDHRGYRNNMEPYARGKAPEAMGWNTENYYRQRGYY